MLNVTRQQEGVPQEMPAMRCFYSTKNRRVLCTPHAHLVLPTEAAHCLVPRGLVLVRGLQMPICKDREQNPQRPLGTHVHHMHNLDIGRA